MEKPADAQFPIHALIRQRWSPRAFSPRPVEPEILQSLMEAARWAPSSFNEQPWGYLVATKENPATYQRMLGCLVPFNQGWAQAAPVLMISVAKLHFERSGKENRHGFHDVGLASENLVIQAQSMGIVVHQMAGLEVDKTRQEFGIPEGWEPVAAIALGYPGELESLSEDLRERELEPRTRKRLDAFVFEGKWGEPAGFVAQRR